MSAPGTTRARRLGLSRKPSCLGLARLKNVPSIRIHPGSPCLQEGTAEGLVSWCNRSRTAEVIILLRRGSYDQNKPSRMVYKVKVPQENSVGHLPSIHPSVHPPSHPHTQIIQQTQARDNILENITRALLPKFNLDHYHIADAATSQNASNPVRHPHHLQPSRHRHLGSHPGHHILSHCGPNPRCTIHLHHLLSFCLATAR